MKKKKSNNQLSTLFSKEIYQRLSIQEKELNAIRQLCTGNPGASALFFSKIDSPSVKFGLESLIKSFPPILQSQKEYSISLPVFQWCCYSIAKLMGHSLDYDHSKLFLSLLSTLKMSNYATLINFLSQDKPQTESLPKDQVISMYKESVSLFRALSGKITKHISVNDYSMFIQRIGSEAFNILPSNLIDVNSFILNEYSDVVDIFSYPVFYISNEISISIQNNFFSKNPFPSPTFFGGKSRLAALFNTSAASKQHFIDISLKGAADQLKSGDLKLSSVYTSLFPELYSWAICSIFHEKCYDANWITSTLSTMQTNSNDICSVVFQRVMNDLQLLKKIKMYTGNSATLRDLSNQSLPNILVLLMKSLNGEPFRDMPNFKLFSISDQDLLHDYDFVCAYFAIENVMKLFFDGHDDFLMIMEASIKNISDPNIQQDVITDIYSLLFLKTQENTFICPTTLAEKVISTLIGFSSGSFKQYLKHSYEKLLMSKFLDPACTLDSVLDSYYTMLTRSILKMDWPIAESIVNRATIYKTLFEVARFVADYKLPTSSRPFKPFSINQNRRVISSEIGFSFMFEYEALNFLNDGNDVISVLSRKRTLLQRKHPMKNVKRGLSQKFRDVVSQLSRLTAIQWEPLADFSNSPLTNSFISYINTIILALLKSMPNKTMGEVLSIHPSDIVPYLLSRELFTQATEVTGILKMDLIETVLKYTKSNYKVLLPLTIDYPVVSIASLVTDEKIDNDGDIGISNVVKNILILKRSPKTHSDMIIKRIGLKKSIISIDMSNWDDLSQDGMDIFQLSTYLSYLLSQDPLPSDEIIDLSFRFPAKEFSKIIEPKLNELPLIELSNILLHCYCEQSLYNKVQLLANILETGISPYPLKKAFSELLSKQKYSLAQLFCDFFRYEMNILVLIREEALSLLHENKDVKELFSICPSLNNEIIESLPQKYRDIITHDIKQFFDSIPHEWKKGYDAIATVRLNIRDYQNVVRVLSMFNYLDCDEDLISSYKDSIMKSNSTISLLLNLKQFVFSIHPSFRNPAILLKYVQKRLSSFVRQISVNNSQDESVAIQTLYLIDKHIDEYLSIFCQYQSVGLDALEDLSAYTKSIYLFVSSMFSSINGISYTLNNYLSIEAGKTFVEYCFLFDKLEIAQSLSKTWKIHTSEYFDKYSLKMFELGLYEEGIQYAIDRRMKNSQHTSSIVQQAISCFRFGSYYDITLIKELKAQDIPFDVEIFVEEFLSPHLIRDSPLFAHLFAPTNVPMNLNSSIRFGETFDPSKTIPIQTFDPNRKIAKKATYRSPEMTRSSSNFFAASKHERQRSEKSLASVQPSVLFSQNIEQIDTIVPHFYYRLVGLCHTLISSAPPQESIEYLNKYLNEKAPVHEHTKFLVESRVFSQPFRILRQTDRGQKRWDLFFGYIFIPSLSHSTLDNFKTAAFEFDPELEIFGPLFQKLLDMSISKSLPHLKFNLEMYLGLRHDALSTAKTLFSQATSTKESVIFLKMIEKSLGSGISNQDTESQKMLEGVVLQKQFCTFCASKSIIDCSSMSIFGKEESRVSSVSFLFKEMEVELALKIVAHTGISLKLIANRLTDIMANEPEKNMIEFVTNFEKRAPGYIFEAIINSMLMRVSFEHMNQKLAQMIIKSCIHDPTFKCKLLTQFGFLESAFSIAKQSGLYDMIPLIAHQCHKTGLNSIVDESNKIFDKLLSKAK